MLIVAGNYTNRLLKKFKLEAHKNFVKILE